MGKRFYVFQIVLTGVLAFGGLLFFMNNAISAFAWLLAAFLVSPFAKMAFPSLRMPLKAVLRGGGATALIIMGVVYLEDLKAVETAPETVTYSVPVSNQSSYPQPPTEEQRLAREKEQEAINKANELKWKQDAEDEKVRERIKAKAKRTFPNDYIMQEAFIVQETDAFEYMKTLPDGQIKRSAIKQFPSDYIMQQAYYNQQLEAKERLESN